MTLIADTLRESGDMEHWPLRPCSSGSASPVHVGCKSASLRQSAARAPPKGRHKRGPVLMRGGTPASPDATNETLTTARGGSAHQKEENGR